MKQAEIVPCLTAFFIDNADANQMHIEDLKNWVVKWNDGIMPDHNNLYDALTIIKSFLKCERKNIFLLDHKKIEAFFLKYPEKSKEFKTKKGRV